jgi:rare lipoprotein A
MRFPIQRQSVQLRYFLAVSAIALAVSGPAYAGKQNPAPIVFAGQGASVPQNNSTSVASRQQMTAPAPGEEGKRIAFRYPGQGAVAAPTASREYASTRAPQMSAPSSATTQIMTPNSFDGRATAAAIAANRQPASVDAEALAPLEPAYQPPEPGVVASSQASAFILAPESAPVFDETGIAVTYGDEFSGLPTANGEVFDQEGLTAAHPTLPLPSLIQVINLETQKEVVVRVNDRGPFEDGASLQLSKRAASALSFGADGRAKIRVRYLGAAPVSSQAVAFQPSLKSARVVPATYNVGSQEELQAPVQYASVSQPDGARTTLPARTGQGSYFVQVGSFSDIGNAQTVQRSLGSDLPVLIIPARVNGADYFRVRVGPFDDRHSAAQMRDDLTYRGLANGKVVSAD